MLGEPFSIGFEHAAACGDIDAAALAEGAGETGLAEDALEPGTGFAGLALESGGGVEGDKIDMGIDTGEERGEAGGGFGGIVFAFDECPLEEDSLRCEACVGAAGIDQFGEGPAFAGGDESGAFLFGGTVEADGEAVGGLGFRHAEDAGDHSDGADGDFGWADACAADVGEDVEGGHDRVVVVEGFAHAHEDDVADFEGGVDGVEDAAGVEDLADDFAGVEVADEAHLAGGAEHAAHGAAGLGADADRVASFVSHEDGFDDLPIGEAEEEFAGESVVAVDFLDDVGLVESLAGGGIDMVFAPACEGR